MRLILLFCIAIIFFSCQKEISGDNKPGGSGETGALSFGNKGQIYLSMNVVDTLLTYPFYSAYKPRRNATLCYDIEKDTALWFKTDTMFATSPLPGEGGGFILSGGQYYKNFKIGNELVKIIAKEILSPLGNPDYLVPSGNYTGIYLEKRDIKTGNVLLMKKLLDPSEFNVSMNTFAFLLSNIINMGDKFYFGVNNGYMYCYDKDGVQIWKKNGYSPRLAVNTAKLGFLYNNATRIAYLSNDNKLNLIDAASGNKIWSVPCSPYQEEIEMVLTNKYIFVFNRFTVDRYNLSDGFNGFDDYFLTHNGMWGNYPFTEIQPFNAIIDDTTVCFWTDDGNYLNIAKELTQLNGVAKVNRPYYGKYLSSYPNSFFCVSHNVTPEAIKRIDFNLPDNIVWSSTFTNIGLNIGQELGIYDILADNKYLYMIARGNLNGYNLIPYDPNKKFGNALYLYVINPANGAIISKGKIFSNPQYSLQDAFAITLGNK